MLKQTEINKLGVNHGEVLVTPDTLAAIFSQFLQFSLPQLVPPLASDSP